MSAAVATLGANTLLMVEWLGATGRQAVRTLVGMVSPPFRFRLLLAQLDAVGFGSLFIVGLTGFFAGMVFSWNTLSALLQMQAESMVAPSMTLALTRELGPIFSALLVAGRCGSAIATELGTMKVSEQVDAMEMMGVDPIRYLAVPRAWALVLAMPLLNAFFVFCGLIGSVAAAAPYDITAALFAQEALRLVDANDFLIGTIKAVFFGFMIAVVATRQGLTATGGARGVGEAATVTVVVTSVLVLLMDYVLMLILAPVMLGFSL